MLESSISEVMPKYGSYVYVVICTELGSMARISAFKVLKFVQSVTVPILLNVDNCCNFAFKFADA